MTQETQDKISESQRPWRNWYWWLPYAGGISGLLILLGSLLTFSISFSRDIYRALTWREGVNVITFSTMAPQVFLNSGDGEVFISHIDVQGQVFSQIININRSIEPKQFLSVPVNDDTLKELGGKSVVTTNSDEEWRAILETKLKGSADPTYHAVVYFAGSPELAMYKRVLNDRLRTFPLSATMVYFTVDGKTVKKSVAVEGIILH